MSEDIHYDPCVPSDCQPTLLREVFMNTTGVVRWFVYQRYLKLVLICLRKFGTSSVLNFCKYNCPGWCGSELGVSNFYWSHKGFCKDKSINPTAAVERQRVWSFFHLHGSYICVTSQIFVKQSSVYPWMSKKNVKLRTSVPHNPPWKSWPLPGLAVWLLGRTRLYRLRLVTLGLITRPVTLSVVLGSQFSPLVRYDDLLVS